MNSPKVDLSSYRNPEFDRGNPRWKEFCWILVSALFFQNPLSLWNGLKIWWLRRFGAKVGRGVLIKPGVQIKFPWRLSIGDHSWIGEHVWIDNLAPVSIGPHVCISQGAFILTGNHNYKKTTFDLMVLPVTIEEGAWVGAKAVVCPGVCVATQAILSAGSVATTGNLSAFGIYQGNPAVWVRNRDISTSI